MVESRDKLEEISTTNVNSIVNSVPRKNFLYMRTKKTSLEEDTKCGLCCIQPRWLQILASKKTYIIVYALAGAQQLIVESYFVGTLSTIEKHFRLSAQESGIINGAWDFGGLFANIAITYVAAKGHRTRWLAMGLLVVGISSFVRLIPFMVFGPGEDIKMYTKEYGYNVHFNDSLMSPSNGNLTGSKKQSTNVNCGVENGNTDAISFYIFIVAQIILGIGSSLYWTCGATYLDDNVRKNIVPALFSIVHIIRLFGPTVGFLLSSYALQLYVDPNLTPNITINDPRWIGAWWLGWCPIGTTSVLLGFLMLFFPRSLPRAAVHRKSTNIPEFKEKTISINDFKESIQRIITNKIFVFNSLSSVFFILCYQAYWTFMPKYLESQFRFSVSKSNFLTGTVAVLCNALGVLTAGVVTSKVKPRPRFLVGWIVVAEFLGIISYVSYAFMSCEEQVYHGHWDNGHNWNVTETCNAKFNCGNDIQFAPVCDTATGLAFYSSCHAGCISSSFINDTLEYSGCTCVPGSGMVKDGLCPTDCSFNIQLLIVIMAFVNFNIGTVSTLNTLIQFRCIGEEDKSLSIGVTETLLGLFSYIPAPFLYGVIMDWACIVWGDDCGQTGNCWIYDGLRLRFTFNLTAAAFLLIAMSLDCFLWYYVKGLKIYDQDYDFEIKYSIRILPNDKYDKSTDQNEIVLPVMKSLENNEGSDR